MKKRVYLLMILLLTGILSYAQLTGTKVIPGDYPTLAAAITALNSSGVGTGGVIFNIAAGYTETFATPTAGLISTSTSGSLNPITIRKSGTGSNPIITAGTGVGTADFIFCISGTNNITIDNIDVQDNPANLTSITQMEWGFAILKASASQGSQNVTIKNCTITLNKSNSASVGIYMDNVIPSDPLTQLIITTFSGTNSGNKFYNNSLSNVYTGIYLTGFADPNSPYTYYDQNNDIGSQNGNSITDFGGGSVSVYGIYLAYQNGLTVANSTINGGVGTTGNLYGIYGGTASNANASFYGNSLTLTSSGSTANLYGIYNLGIGNGGTANTLNFYNNSLLNCTYSTATTVLFYGIYNVATAGTINMYGNFAQNNIIGGTSQQYLIYTNSTAGNTVNVYSNIVSGNQCSGTGTQSNLSYIFGIQTIGWGNVSIHDNQVFNNSIPNQTLYGGAIYGIHSGFSAANVTINNNSIHDLSVGGSATVSTSFFIYGIFAGTNSFSNASTNSVHDNNIYNLGMTLSTTQNAYIYGIYSYYCNSIFGNIISNMTVTNSLSGYSYGAGIYNITAGTGYIYKNIITNALMAGTSGYFNGIYLNNGDNATVYNNFISDLKAPFSTSTTALSGIYINTPVQVALYFNSIYINGTSSSTGNFGTAGVYANTSANLEMRNNLIINTSTAPGSATYKAAAFRRSSTNLTTYQAVSNNNDFYSGPPSANNLIFYDGTNSVQTLAAFKAFVIQSDANSISEFPPFANITTQPYDLHLKTSIANQEESGGSVVSGLLNITTDIDGDARYPNSGYPVKVGYPPTAPDMGADEFGGMPLDLTPPSILFTPLAKTSSTSARTLQTTITDASGVPTSGSGLPVLYWKKFASGTWNSAIANWTSGNTYTFMFGGGVVLNDSIYYYIVAQDIASPTPNVGATPSNVSGYSTSPPACSVPPPNSSCYSYKIVGTICGTYNVGTGQAYATISSALSDLNNMEVTCPVVFLLTDATYPSETFPLVINNPTGVSALNTVTIKPAAGVSPTISGSATSILKFNSASYVTIDGSNSGGSDRSLTISNTVASGTTAVIWIGSSGPGRGSTNDMIKNCNIKNGYMTSTSYDLFIGSASAIGSPGDDNDNLTIQNNAISKANRGIYAQASTNGLNDNLHIFNNILGSDISTFYLSAYGIYLIGANAPQITGNVIYNMINSTSFILCGIELNSNVNDALVSNNSIHDLKSSYAYGPSMYGINIGTAYHVTNATLINNLIYNITGPRYAAASTQYNPFGVRVVSGSGHKIYHNAIYLTGIQSAPGTSASLSACIVFPYPIVSGTDVRNNLLANDLIGAAGSSSYCIYGVAGLNFGIIDNNDYYPAGAYGILGYLGGIQNTLSSWQAATGQDSFSVSVDPVFSTSTALLPTTADMPHAGVYLTAVPTDYNGSDRTNPPDIGAYEYSSRQTVITTTATSLATYSASLNGTINASNAIVTSGFDYGLTIAYGSSSSATPATITGNTTTAITSSVSGLLPNTMYHFRAKGLSGNATVYGNDSTFTTAAIPPLVVTLPATSIISDGATLNGSVNPNGVSASVSFDYGLTTSYGSTAVAAQSPVNGSSAVSVNASITGLLPFNTYHFRVVSINNGGTSYGDDLTFTTTAIPAIVVTNPATNVTPVSAQLNGTVTANFAPTTTSFEWGLTTAYGNNVTAIPSSVSGNSSTAILASITGLSWATSYHFRAVGINAGGTAYGADMVFNTDCPSIPAPGFISGPSSVCQNQNAVVYSVANVPNASSYTWTIPTGATITSGQGSNTINVDFSPTAISGNITVTPSNTCTTGPAGSMPVTVNPMPVPTISGSPASCDQSTDNIYTTESGMTGYTWTVSSGGVITDGAGTASITVTWNNTGTQSVSVNYSNTNGCTAVNPGTFSVTVNALPAPTLSGSTSICVNSGYYNYTTETGMNAYNWTISSGGSIYAGQGTSNVTVLWNSAGAQSIGVNYENASGCQAVNPTLLDVTVNDVPEAAGPISGSTSVCAGTQTVPYSVAAITGALTYVWTLPSGATIASGEGTNMITVDYAGDAASGQITVMGNNYCGNGSTSNLSVIVNPIPSTPTITANGYVLTSSAATGNQWYHDGTVVAGETNQTYTVPASAPGWYWTVVTLENCSSDQSNQLYIQGVGIEQHNADQVNIYPVPNDGRFNISISSGPETTYKLEVLNSLGVRVYGDKIITVGGTTITPVDLGFVASGLYTLVLSNTDKQVIRKMLVKK